MIEVYSRLFVGSAQDYEEYVSRQNGWAVVQACKEPYHRKALGYQGRSADRTHPEYLMAQRENRLILNMIDVDDPSFFSKDMIDEVLDFIDAQHHASLHVLVHCTHGLSRSPSLALLCMAARFRILPTSSLESAEEQFIKLYPPYNPKSGIRGHLALYWDQYCREGAVHLEDFRFVRQGDALSHETGEGTI
jgi:hypothetical protein